MDVKKSSRYYIWLVKALLTKHYPIILIGFIVGFLLSTLLSTFQLKIPQIQKQKMVAVVGNYDISTLPEFLQTMISRGLTKTAEDGQIIGDIASDVKVEDNGKKYTFKIKDNVRWQDGKKFSSKDVNYNFKDVKIETPDDQTIVYTLKENFAPFPSLTTQPLFRPALMGLGEYKLTNIKRNNNRIDFLTIKEIKTGNEIIYKFYPSEQSAITGFKLGEVNNIQEIKDRTKLEGLNKVKVSETVNKNNFVAVFFNLRDQTLQDKSLRQALAYSIKEETKDGNKALSSYDPDSWVYNDKVKKYEFDLANAKKLLGKNSNASQSANLKINLATTQLYKSLADQIAEDWKSIGIDTEIQTVKTKPDNFQLLLTSSQIPVDPDQYSMWHSTQSTNITGYQSPKVDKLLEDGRKTTDVNERKQIYLDLQKALLEDLPAIFLFYPKTYSVERI